MMGTYDGSDTPPHLRVIDEEILPPRKERKANGDVSVAGNDNQRRVERSTTKDSFNGYDSDVIYDMDTASEDDDD